MLLKVADSQSEGFHSHCEIGNVGLGFVCDVNDEFSCAPVIPSGELPDDKILSFSN